MMSLLPDCPAPPNSLGQVQRCQPEQPSAEAGVPDLQSRQPHTHLGATSTATDQSTVAYPGLISDIKRLAVVYTTVTRRYKPLLAAVIDFKPQLLVGSWKSDGHTNKALDELETSLGNQGSPHASRGALRPSRSAYRREDSRSLQAGRSRRAA